MIKIDTNKKLQKVPSRIQQMLKSIPVDELKRIHSFLTGEDSQKYLLRFVEAYREILKNDLLEMRFDDENNKEAQFQRAYIIGMEWPKAFAVEVESYINQQTKKSD